MKLTHIIFLSLLFTFQSTYADITKTILPETNLIEWKLLDENLELKLIQRLPDQTRSFFEGRGFSKKITDDIAQSCVFQTITRNTSKAKDQSIQVALKNWSIKINHKTQPIKFKEDWDKQWTDNDVKPASRLAFRWAT